VVRWNVRASKTVAASDGLLRHSRIGEHIPTLHSVCAQSALEVFATDL